MEIEEIFKDEIINEAKVLVSEYKFSLDGISKTITIKIYKNIRTGYYEFYQSHFIHTPLQAGPYITSRPWNDTEDLALNQAISGFTQFYNAAIKNGYKPDDSWLVENKDFK
ncbi:hypothetical protein [Thermosulfurimonas dismutans]|uniref:Uncharacterized protein n=1 Tax=Thermosulfurimonas dismutans TaxID=999894 RepID=A0A179D219_9BACT|nr:hypothetical protein [Thermosulfurimonas dismutans]OAQ20033.1 hypothetical protein TDIS_1852 [Thermosulfurimonas dismutans]